MNGSQNSQRSDVEEKGEIGGIFHWQTKIIIRLKTVE